MSKPLAIAFAILAATSWSSLAGSVSALAQGGGVGTGPVGTICDKDIKTYCADLKHGAGAVRSCLEENRAKVSQDCRTALDTTGGGRMAK
jgi:hypothetical protein